MKQTVITIIKKELRRFFGDRRLLFTVLLPGLLIYVLYSFMGGALSRSFTTDEDYVYTVRAVHMSPTIAETYGALLPEVTPITEADIDAAKQAVAAQTLDLLVIFPADFDDAIQPPVSGEVPQVQLYYNTTRVQSGEAYARFAAVLNQYESDLTNLFDINRGGEPYDLASNEDMVGQIFSMMMPMLLMIFMFTGCVAVAPESIAGEKERGTISTLLVTPLPRSQLAIGKIVSLTIISLLSGLSSFLGTMLSLPKLMAIDGFDLGGNYYGAGDYFMLLLVIFTSILLIVAIISVVSAYAKTVKEATSYLSVMMVFATLIGVTGMIGGNAPKALWLYLIPLYNSVQAMNGIFSFSYQGLHIALTALSNLLLAGLMAFVLTRMFNSEKVMFSK
ncbi:MAG: ABC transporter permease [Eubacteriales bacterium]